MSGTFVLKAPIQKCKKVYDTAQLKVITKLFESNILDIGYQFGLGEEHVVELVLLLMI